MRNQIFLEIDKVRQIIRNDDGDAEMIQLCSQLAGEISTKTSHALEIERLKQIGGTEKETQATEKKSMEDELRRVKELLEMERNKNAKMGTEAAHWRALYEERQVDKD
jgi:DNA gyrase/topoisomerase IV subunit A